MYAEMEANMAAEDTVQRLIETLEVEEADAMRERQLEELSHLLTGEYFASHKETLETLGALAERKETELRGSSLSKMTVRTDRRPVDLD